MKKRSLGLFITACVASLPFSASAITLQELYDQALQNEHQLKADEARYKAGLEAKKQARAGLLPQINARGVYSDRDATDSQINPQTGRFAVFDLESTGTNYRLTLTQPLFDAGAWFNYQQGKRQSEQAKAQFAADQQAFILRVAEAYFNVLRNSEVLSNAKAQEKAFKHQLEQTKQRYEVGLTAITDVHDAQASFDSSRANSLVSLNNLGISYEALGILSGLKHTTVSPLTDKFQVTPPEPSQQSSWVEFAIQNNNQLKVSKLNAAAFKQASRSATSGHLPRLTLGFIRDESVPGEATVRGETRNDIPDTNSNTISLTMEVPIFSGGRVSASRRQAAQQYEQAQQTYLQTKRTTMQNARSQHLTVVADVATVSARKQAIVSSESSLEATQAGYEVGTRDFVDVLNAQQRVFQSKSDYYNALYDYILNTLRLKQTAGTLSPQDIADLDRWLDKAKTVDWNRYNTL